MGLVQRGKILYPVKLPLSLGSHPMRKNCVRYVLYHCILPVIALSQNVQRFCTIILNAYTKRQLDATKEDCLSHAQASCKRRVCNTNVIERAFNFPWHVFTIDLKSKSATDCVQ